jgi:hypothetical protein
MNQSELSIATIRSLGIDMINKANSGHPGMVLGSAPALYTLFTKELKIYPKKSEWFNRDRFVYICYINLFEVFLVCCLVVLHLFLVYLLWFL